MKKLIFILAAMLSLAPCHAGGKPHVKFAWDVDFETNFDNREYYESNFTSSMTIFAARLEPYVGLSLDEKNGSRHKVMLGVEMLKDFGSEKKTDLFRELSLYYNFEKKIGQTKMGIYAGVFPRSAMQGSYSQAFFSDSLRFYDNHLEGLLFKFKRPNAYYEVGCDWMGQYGAEIREKFMIFTAGEGKVLPFMSMGYAGYMLHFANSGRSKGLVDNILFNPYVRFDLGGYTGLQTLSFRLGWLQAMQRDREYAGVFVHPFGGEFDQEVRNWNVGILNKMFYGQDMMPYYNNYDNAGLKYGTDLYYGDPFYRIHDDGRTGMGLYDRFEVYYEPKICDFLKLRISALFHFHDFAYSGCQQMISVCFDMSKLLSRKERL